MENNFEDIDNLFKDGLGDYTEVPPPPVWQALEKRLDNDRKRRVFPFRWFWYISLISFVLLGASVAFKIANDNHPAVAVNTTEDGTAVSKTQEATPAPNTPANEKPVAGSGHLQKNKHRRHTKKTSSPNTLVTNRKNKTSEATTSTTTIAIVEDIKPVRPRQENYNSSTSELYSYEDEGTEPVKNAEIINVPQIKEDHDGYVVNKTRKHNLVAADMTPVVREEKTPVITRTTVNDDANETIDEHVDSRVAQVKHKETVPAPSTVKAQKNGVTKPSAVAHKDAKIIPAASYTLHEDTHINSVKQHKGDRSNEPQKQMASTKKARVNRIPAAVISGDSGSSATVAVTTDSKTATKHHVRASKELPAIAAKHNETNKPKGSEVARKNNRKNSAISDPLSKVSSAATVPAVVAATPEEENNELPAKRDGNAQIPPTPGNTSKEIIASTAISKQNIKSNKPKAVPAPVQPVAKNSKKSGGRASSAILNDGREKANKTSVTTTSTAVTKQGTNHIKKTTALANRDNLKTAVVPTPEKSEPAHKKPASKKIAAKKAGGSKQSIALQHKNAVNVYAAAPSQKNTAAMANNTKAGPRPSLNSDMGSIEEPSIIDVVPQAAPSHNDVVDNTTAVQPAQVAPAVPSVAADSPSSRVSRFSYGVKSGFEAGFKQGAAGKFLISPYLEYKLSSKISLMTQPAIKASYLGGHTIGNASIYFDTSHSAYNYTLTDSYTIFVPGVGLLMSRQYKYAETHDSIAKSYTVGGTYVEVELPLLLKYSITPKLSVYGGLNMGYSRLMRIKESTFTTSVEYTKPVATVTGLTQPPPDPATQLGAVVFAGSAIGNYSGPVYPTQSGGMFRLGYMLGFSYEIKKRWMIDALIQQAKANSYIQGGYNVNTALSLPYFRLTLGYRLSK